MSEFDILLERVVNKSKFTREEIKKLVEQKKEKIGAGYLTDSGALYLIASDLGISLTMETIEKKSPMESISVETIAQEDLKKKAETLTSDRKRKNLRSNFFSPLAMLILISFSVVAPGINSQTFDIFFILGLIGFIGGSILMLIILKLPRRFLEKKEIIFLKFYETYSKINEYNYRDKNYDTKKYQKHINDLAYFIDSWTRSGSPSVISELPDSISSNLKKQIIPIFKNNDSQNIKKFLLDLEKMVMFCYTQEPTAHILRSFNDELSEFKISETKIIEESKSNLLIRLIWLSPISGILFFLVLHQIDPTQIHASLGYSVTAAIAILIAIFTLVKKR